MNIWCRCVLSGRNGDEPFSIRVDITRSVSNTGTDNTASDIGVDKGCDPRAGLQDGDHEDGHDGAHDQRPAVADEHL